MNKKTTFLWGWRGYEPTLDPTMTRARAAILLRAWRRSRTQGHRNFSLKCVKRVAGEHTYRVEALDYVNETSTLVIRGTP